MSDCALPTGPYNQPGQAPSLKSVPGSSNVNHGQARGLVTGAGSLHVGSKVSPLLDWDPVPTPMLIAGVCNDLSGTMGMAGNRASGPTCRAWTTLVQCNGRDQAAVGITERSCLERPSRRGQHPRQSTRGTSCRKWTCPTVVMGAQRKENLEMETTAPRDAGRTGQAGVAQVERPGYGET